MNFDKQFRSCGGEGEAPAEPQTKRNFHLMAAQQEALPSQSPIFSIKIHDFPEFKLIPSAGLVLGSVGIRV
jgi:hypothetical protein